MKTYKIFVASPGDVKKERIALDKIAEAVNRTSGSAYAARIELFRWERDSIPGVGTSPQAIIDAQAIDSDTMDGVIVLLWCRYGTLLKSGISGWHHEFDKFRSRIAPEQHFKIMTFVKNEKISPRDVDASQLSKVNDFLGTFDDGLYMSFSKPAELENLVQSSLTHFLKMMDLISKRHRMKLP